MRYSESERARHHCAVERNLLQGLVILLLSSALLCFSGAVLSSCRIWGEFDNPKDSESGNYQGYDTILVPDLLRTYRPEKGSILNSWPDSFIVSEVIGALAYELRLSTSMADLDTESPFYRNDSFQTHILSPALEEPARGMWYWKARARSTEGWGNWSATSSFTHDPPLPRADLSISALNVERPADTTLRGFTSCSFSILNGGPSGMKNEAATVRYYLSRDQEFSAENDLLIGSTALTLTLLKDETMNANLGQQELESMSKDWVEGTPGNGTWHLFAVIDIDDGVPVDEGMGNDFVATAGFEYTGDPYIVSFDSNQADSGNVPAEIRNYVGDSFTIPGNTGNMQKDGCIFGGWSEQADGSGTVVAADSTMVMPARNIRFHAYWIGEYSIRYHGNGHDSGSIPSDAARYRTGTDVTIAQPGDLAKVQHRFISWNSNSDGSGTDYNPGTVVKMGTRNLDLYARWRRTYGVGYAGNGNSSGTEPVDSNRYLPGETVTVLTNSGGLARSGQWFTGWRDVLDGTQRNPGSTFVMPERDVSLEARWETHTVSPVPEVTGASSGEENESLSFNAEGSRCVFGHGLEYKFDWGDGQQSGWGSGNQSHSWDVIGGNISSEYQVKSKARCSVDQNIETSWSSSHSVTITIDHATSRPNTPSLSGSQPIYAKTSYTYTSGDSTCSWGHQVTQYQFDWGDGSSLSWGGASQQHTYQNYGSTYYVNVKAKCSGGDTSSSSSSLQVKTLAH